MICHDHRNVILNLWIDDVLQNSSRKIDHDLEVQGQFFCLPDHSLLVMKINNCRRTMGRTLNALSKIKP